MTTARCWLCGRRRGPSADGLGSHCRRKLATRTEPATPHAPVVSAAGQLELEEPMTDQPAINLTAGPVTEVVFLDPNRPHTAPDERGCPDCGQDAYFSGCEADGCNSYGCQDCGTGCDLDFASDGRCAQAQPEDGEDMPCGEGMCQCRCSGGAKHSCGCDCAHHDDCDCEDCIDGHDEY